MRKIEGPRDLPYLRDRLAMFETAAVNDETLALQPKKYRDRERWYRGARETQKLIQSAPMYWVTKEMTRLAFDHSHELPDWTPATARPESSGLLVWAEGLPEVASEIGRLLRRQSSHDQATNQKWSQYRPRGFMWWTNLDIDNELEANLCVTTISADPEVPVGDRFFLPLHKPANMSTANGPLIALIGTTWIMMQEPKLAERREVNPGKKDTQRSLQAGDSPMWKVRAPADLDTAARDRAAAEGRNLSDLVRDAVSEYLAAAR